MSDARIVEALAIPSDARVDQRVPKKLLIEQGTLTSTDKRCIQDGVEELRWIAALKPNNIGVPAYRDEAREYLEIAVLTLSLRRHARAGRAIELVHRAIPYPLVLVTEFNGGVDVSFAHKRWSQAESGKVVSEEVQRTSFFDADKPTPAESAFAASLAVSGLPRQNLFALYQACIDCVTSLEAARITGSFVGSSSPEQSAHVREGLNVHARLYTEIAGLRARAEKEKQINRRVDLNLEIKRLEAELLTAAETIKPAE